MKPGGHQHRDRAPRNSGPFQALDERAKEEPVRHRTRDVADEDAGRARSRRGLPEPATVEGGGDRGLGVLEDRHRRLLDHRRLASRGKADLEPAAPVEKPDLHLHLPIVSPPASGRLERCRLVPSLPATPAANGRRARGTAGPGRSLYPTCATESALTAQGASFPACSVPGTLRPDALPRDPRAHRAHPGTAGCAARGSPAVRIRQWQDEVMGVSLRARAAASSGASVSASRSRPRRRRHSW